MLSKKEQAKRKLRREATRRSDALDDRWDIVWFWWLGVTLAWLAAALAVGVIHWLDKTPQWLPFLPGGFLSRHTLFSVYLPCATLWGAAGLICYRMRRRGNRNQYCFTYPMAFLSLCAVVFRPSDFLLCAAPGAVWTPCLLWFLVIVSVVALFFILSEVLDQYWQGEFLSAICAFVFIAFNEPLAACIRSSPENLVALDLALLFLQRYPKAKQIFSPLPLALTLCFQTTAQVLLIPVVWIREKKWLRLYLYWAGGIALSLIVFSLIRHGDCFSWLVRKLPAELTQGGICYANCSVESCVRWFTATYWGNAVLLTVLCRIAILALLVANVVVAVRKEAWKNRKDKVGIFRNAAPMILPAMIFLRPVVHPAEYVFLTLPFLLMLRKVTRRYQAEWYILCWMCIFLLPAGMNDTPLAYLRLVGTVIFLIFSLTHSAAPLAIWFSRLRGFLANLPRSY